MMMNDEIEAGRKGRMIRRIITTCQDGFTAIEVCQLTISGYSNALIRLLGLSKAGYCCRALALYWSRCGLDYGL